MGLHDEYFELYRKHNKEYGGKIALLYPNGKFYEIFVNKHDKGNYIKEDSNGYEILSLLDMKMAERGGILCGGFPISTSEKYIDKLSDNCYTCIVYEQNEEEIEGGKKKFTRNFSHVVSIGNNLKEYSVNESLTNNVCCLFLEMRKNKKTGKVSQVIGFSVINNINGDVKIYEEINKFSCGYRHRHVHTTYNNIEKLINEYNPCQIVFVYETYNMKFTKKQIYDIIHFIGIKENCNLRICDMNEELTNSIINDDDNIIMWYENHREILLKKICVECQKQNYKSEVINQYYNPNDLDFLLENINFFEYEYAYTSLSILLSQLHNSKNNLTSNLSIPKYININNSLELKNYSLTQLNICETSQSSNIEKKYSSVINLLNKCKTSIGKRSFDYIIQNPVRDVEILNKRYDKIEYILSKFETFKNIWNLMNETKDIENICRQYGNNKMSFMSVEHLINTVYITSVIVNICIKNNIEIDNVFDIENTNDNIYVLTGEKYELQSEQSIIYECASIMNFIQRHFNINIEPIDDDEDLIDNIQSLPYFEENKDILNNNSIPKIKLVNDEVNNYINEIKNHKIYTDIDLSSNFNLSDYKDLESLLYELREYRNKFISISQFITQTINKNEKKKLTKNDTYIELKYKNEEYNIKITKKRATIFKNSVSKLDTQQLEYIGYDVENNYTPVIKVFDFVLNDIKIVEKKKIETIQTKQLKLMVEDFNDKVNEWHIKMNNHHKYIETQMKQINNSTKIISDFIRDFDVNINNAYVSKKFRYCKPVIIENIDNNGDSISYLHSKEMRHPILEHIVKQAYIPNDISLDNNEGGILLYGTNTVGKSSLIKSIGINVIMAQCGMYVPCSEFIYYPFDKLFTRIVGSDNMFKGLSTFAIEITEIDVISRENTKNSLVLGDELCSGTEIDSQISIFGAGLMELISKRTKFVFATHLHQLSHIHSLNQSNFMCRKHLDVIYNNEKNELIYTRKLKNGSGNRLYGIEVCKAYNLPTRFMNNAESIRNELSSVYGILNNDFMNGEIVGKKSKYNSNKIISVCENCGEKAVDTHHIEAQEHADDEGYIGFKHKNTISNLMVLCKECHKFYTKEEKKGIKYKKVKTSEGYSLYSE